MENKYFANLPNIKICPLALAYIFSRSEILPAWHPYKNADILTPIIVADTWR